MHTRALLKLALAGTVATLLSACATTVNNPNTAGDSSLAGRVKACRTGDTAVATSDACLQDDAACYQLSNGSWCTGPRGSECPAGSSEIAANAPCPEGNRCFVISEGKNCAISFK